MKKQGFTLIEMLIVVAIIAILASSFLIGARVFRDRAYDSRRISDLPKIQSYLEIYYTTNRSYPNVSSWAQLDTALASLAGISRIPNDPLNISTGREYFYCVSGDGQSYVLGAALSTDTHSSLTDDVDMLQFTNCTSFSASCTDSSPSNGYCVSL